MGIKSRYEYLKEILLLTNISHLLSGVIPTNGRNLSLGMLRFEGKSQFFKPIRVHQISRFARNDIVLCYCF